MVCQPRCALTVRIVEKHFSEPVSLLKTGRMLVALASLPRGTPALRRLVGLRPTPESTTGGMRTGPGKPSCFPEPHLPCIGQSGLVHLSSLHSPVTLLSVPTASITPRTLIIQIFLQIPCPHHWSSHQQPQGQPRTDQAVSWPPAPPPRVSTPPVHSLLS